MEELEVLWEKMLQERCVEDSDEEREGTTRAVVWPSTVLSAEDSYVAELEASQQHPSSSNGNQVCLCTYASPLADSSA